MAEVLLFHHALGLTAGCLSFAAELQSAGHTVHAPDLYEGKTFTTLDEGVDYAQQVGFERLFDRGRLAAESFSNEMVYAGFSLGAMPAQMLAQTRPGAKGALLFHAAAPTSSFGGQWPEGVLLQIHTAEGDEWGDVDVARELADSIPSAELFLYPGDRHLFTDDSLPDYDEDSSRLVKQRVLSFLENID